jgi:hypothetical protein
LAVLKTTPSAANVAFSMLENSLPLRRF